MAVLPNHLKALKALLVKNGFIKKNQQKLYLFDKDKSEWVKRDGSPQNPDDAEAEKAEEVNIGGGGGGPSAGYIESGYPSCFRRYRLIIESPAASIEEPYFWMLEHTRQDMSNPYVEKITDTYSASEQSSFWGAAQSRIGLQQDRAGQYLKGMSEMVKQLFQLVRELRILDEKLEPRKNWKTSQAADLALKAEYTDLVENRGGQIQPGSIYHLAQSVGYTILPDLFFNTRIYSFEDVDKKIDSMSYNTNVKTVLKRKMYAFVNWKTKTDGELTNRRQFTLKYLRQHWNTIKMYMNWVKPYLRNVERMQMNPQDIDSPDLVGAFETSTVELEILAYKPAKKGVHQCSLMSFKFRTRPDLSFQKDQYAHKGPIHMGRVEVDMRAYGWTGEQIEAYKKYRRQEDLHLMGMVDTSVKDAMEALGDELEKYLSEAGEKEFEQKKKEKEALEKKKEKEDMRRSENMLEPFTAVLSGLGELGGALFGPIGSSGGASKTAASPAEMEKAAKDAAGDAAKQIFNVYKNFKKSHGLLSW